MLSRKKDVSYRLFGDYSQLNCRSIPDRYPILRVQDMKFLRGLDFVSLCLEDILNASKGIEEHEQHLKLALEKLDTIDFRINISKYGFAFQEIEFLGYQIVAQRFRPLPQGVQAVSNYKRQENIQDLRTFIGILLFYRRYLKDVIAI
ncbi:hypothetical protein AVEN_1697-1 [Araneus ventricosus]|uniref:Transposon Ty3-I Gag-Pol polyprotein n=1 Tax=Araneus ventricosus TaxID=182803 RepID=A0A4Y2JVR4_ARAVE|nr:hypothetical protein AVEN_1697-1 [Araneus ventricosus]